MLRKSRTEYPNKTLVLLNSKKADLSEADAVIAYASFVKVQITPLTLSSSCAPENGQNCHKMSCWASMLDNRSKRLSKSLNCSSTYQLFHSRVATI